MAEVSPTPFGTPTAQVREPAAGIDAVRGDRSTGWTAQTRSEVLARNGMVATSQPSAAQAGLRVLQDGGNSVDAAIATAAVLGVVEPYSAGLGGDAFVLHYSAESRELYGLNASGWSPKAWSPRYFADRGHTALTGMPPHGPDSVTVPGVVDGWSRLLDRFGSRSFASVLEPAIAYAEQGFPVTERIRHDWAAEEELLRSDPDSASAYLVDDRAPALYSVFRNPTLARAYRTLSRHGRDAFYTGDVAHAAAEGLPARRIDDRGRPRGVPLRVGRPGLSFGNMGGAAQPQAQATELVNMIDLGMNLQAAVDAARFNHSQHDDTLGLEPALRELVGPRLADMGHHLIDASIESMGGYQAIHFTPERPGEWPGSTGRDGPVNGVYRAASDHRKDGAAVGW